MTENRSRTWSLPILAAVAAAGIGVMLLSANLPLRSTSTARAQSTSGDPLLLTLAERLLGAAPPIYGPGPYQSAGQAVQLLPGALPSDLPLNLPMPAGSTLIGSSERPAFPLNFPSIGGPGGFVSTPQQQGGNRIDVVLDTTQKPEDVINFYKGAMSDLGWTAPPAPSFPYAPSLGPSAASSNSYATFCQSASGPWLSVSGTAPDNAATDVRIHVESGSSGTCTAPPVPPLGPPFSPPPFGLLPSLHAPDGVTVQTMGGVGGSQGRFASEATATTDMSVPDLYAYYAKQLADAGWTRIDGASSASLAWSSWSIPDHDGYQGFFYLRSGPAPRQDSLHAEVASTDPNASVNLNGGVYAYPGSSSLVGAVPVTSTARPAQPTATPTATASPSH